MTRLLRNSKKLITATTAVIVVVGGSLSAYAYQSPEVTHGSWLYGIKESLEIIEGSFATSSEARAAYHLKRAKRRISEGRALADRGISDERTNAQIRLESDQILSVSAVIANPDERENIWTEYNDTFLSGMQDIQLYLSSGQIKELEATKDGSEHAKRYAAYIKLKAELETGLLNFKAKTAADNSDKIKRDEGGNSSSGQLQINANINAAVTISLPGNENLNRNYNKNRNNNTQRNENKNRNLNTNGQVNTNLNINLQINMNVSTGDNTNKNEAQIIALI